MRPIKNKVTAYVTESDINKRQLAPICNDATGGITSIRVMSIEEATRLGILEAENIIKAIDKDNGTSIHELMLNENAINEPELKIQEYDQE
jgi:hypothetical protein